MVTLSEKTDPATTPPLKYSRYRAVRQQAEVAKVEPIISAPQDSNDASITRSMSRYRRTRPASKADHTIPSPPLIPLVPKNPFLSPSGHAEGIRRATDPIRPPQKQQLPMRNDTVTGIRTHGKRETETERLQRKAREIREQEDIHKKVQKDQEEQELREAKAKVEQTRLDEEEKQRLLAEQKRKDLERLEAELEAAGPLPVRVTTPSKEKFSFFSRKRSATKTTANTSGSGKDSLSMSRTRSHDSPSRPSNDAQTQGIEKAGSLPGSDAPMSAVNAGERRVLIRCKQSSINLPITPETTPMEIVYSAANIMTQNITPSTAILLESYTQLGLERRVRRYEHVRDIMNSWDRDTQNALLLTNSDSPNNDHDLETYSVPRERPKDVTVYMYHSQKPGKWNKRYITLLSSGQIFMSKKTGAKPADKDAVSLCHLSDFDIYTPTAQQLRKVLRPPKKHCYAIKSQQKTTMFLSTENFVHFFNTDEEALANKWYNTVQRWRSWYLVNRMGEGKKSTQKTTASNSRRPATKAGPTHKVKASVDEDPYTIGSFKPLMNIDRFSSPSDAQKSPDYDSEDENRPRQIPFHLRNIVSLDPLPSRRESKRHPPPVSYRLPAEADEEFASSGLLGRSYSQRQRAHKDREVGLRTTTNPFVDGPSLLNGAELQRPETSAGPGGFQRSGSKREKPKPLLDFTPQFKEAPQWDKTGKGHGVPAPCGVPLVDVATTPETGLDDIPKGTLFRREGRPATSAGGKPAEKAFIKGGLVSEK